MLSPARIALVVLALIMPGMAFAASDPFAGEVEQKCTGAAGETFRRPQVIVDPNGTQSYGLAFIFGRSKAIKGRAALICVVDRRTGKVELGTALGPSVVRVRGPKDEQAQTNGKRNKRNKAQNNAQGAQQTDDDSGQDDEDDSDGGQ